MSPQQKIVPCLWFDWQAEQAAEYYVSVFGKGSKILRIVRYGAAGPGPKGKVLTVSFQLAGQEFLALNGGPTHRFNEAVSLSVDCETQAELDELWEKLSEGGQQVRCGWLKDRYGLSWQIVPAILPELMGKGNDAASDRVMKALLGMKKLDIDALKRAHKGG